MKVRIILVLIILLATNTYVVWHLWRITPSGWPAKLTVALFFVLWTCLFVAGLAATERVSIRTATFLYEAGMPWMIAFLYLLLLFAIADIGVLCRLFPKALFNGSAVGFCSVIGLTAVLMLAGSIHYRHKYREEITILTDKPLARPLTIVLASDLHLGYHNRRAELARWVNLFNAEHPDIVLFGGDIVDRSIRPVLAGDYAAEFKRIEAPVYSVLGNHEYYSDREKATSFFREAGITVLKDGSADVASIRIIGRDDRNHAGRKTLPELVSDTAEFTILV
ncbi:MAG: metallophosphoesterase, partial [Bacteroidales bacterium]|nr:metallophosphoesterase [Bacteroidales bacterium]